MTSGETERAGPDEQQQQQQQQQQEQLGRAGPSSAASFVVRPVGERQRRYVEDGERSDAGAARERRFAGERFRREVFELFEATRGLLDRWTVGSYLKEYRDPNRRSSTVVTMDTSLTVGEGLTLLAHAGVLSAPVMDVDALLFLGFQDVGDFLAGLMLHLERVKPPPPAPGPSVGTALVATSTAAAAARMLKDEGRRRWVASLSLEDLVKAGSKFCRASVRELREELVGNEDGRMIYRGKQDTTLLDLVRAGFLRTIVTPGSDQGRAETREGDSDATLPVPPVETVATVPRRGTTCHRVAVYCLDYNPEVMDDTLRIDAVISQSDIIRFLNHHRGALGLAMRWNLHDIGLGGEWDDDPGVGATDAAKPEATRFVGNVGGVEVACVLPTTRTLEAFSFMHAEGVSAVGVVREPRGPLVDCLSVSDLRGMREERLAELNLSVADFTAMARPPGTNPRLVTVTPDADLGNVLERMAFHRVHHVFVVDLEGRPIRMVTPADVLKVLALPSASNLGWRFQISADLHSTYAFEEAMPIA